MKAELLLDLRAELGEGAIWNPLTSRLCFVDILGKRVHEYDPESGRHRHAPTPAPVGTVVPRRKGGLIVALANGMAEFDLDTGRTGPVVVPVEHDPSKTRFNDGKCDPQGRFWAGTFGRGLKDAGSLYCFAPGEAPRRVLGGIGISNGLAWSLDGRRMYFIDTLARGVDAFDFDPKTGSLSNRKTTVRIPGVYPDGSTIDAEGKLWVAEWGGSKVGRWDPETGEFLGGIEVGAPQVSSCAFGGKNLDTLYITTAWEGMDEAARAKAPLSGGVFTARPGIRGIPANCYAG